MALVSSVVFVLSFALIASIRHALATLAYNLA